MSILINSNEFRAAGTKLMEVFDRRIKEGIPTETVVKESFWRIRPDITLLTYTGLVVELEHLKIETRLTWLIDEKFANAMGQYVT